MCWWSGWLVGAGQQSQPFDNANIDTAVDEMVRVLRPGGRLILVDHIASSNRLARSVQRLLDD